MRICRYFIHVCHGESRDDKDKVNGYLRCYVLGFYVVAHETFEEMYGTDANERYQELNLERISRQVA